MEQIKSLNRTYEAVGWGALLLLWGATILFDFIPFEIGVAGTGLILLGVNAVRSLNHLPTKNDTILLGILMFAWGGLELARPFLHLMFTSADLDLVIFAILLMGVGLILLIRGFFWTLKAGSSKELNP
jgi:hypothetical protein